MSAVCALPCFLPPNQSASSSIHLPTNERRPSLDPTNRRLFRSNSGEPKTTIVSDLSDGLESPLLSQNGDSITLLWYLDADALGIQVPSGGSTSSGTQIPPSKQITVSSKLLPYADSAESGSHTAKLTVFESKGKRRRVAAELFCRAESGHCFRDTNAVISKTGRSLSWQLEKVAARVVFATELDDDAEASSNIWTHLYIGRTEENMNLVTFPETQVFKSQASLQRSIYAVTGPRQLNRARQGDFQKRSCKVLDRSIDCASFLVKQIRPPPLVIRTDLKPTHNTDIKQTDDGNNSTPSGSPDSTDSGIGRESADDCRVGDCGADDRSGCDQEESSVRAGTSPRSNPPLLAFRSRSMSESTLKGILKQPCFGMPHARSAPRFLRSMSESEHHFGPASPSGGGLLAARRGSSGVDSMRSDSIDDDDEVRRLISNAPQFPYFSPTFPLLLHGTDYTFDSREGSQADLCGSKKSVRFAEKVLECKFRPNSSILGQRKKNARKPRRRDNRASSVSDQRGTEIVSGERSRRRRSSEGSCGSCSEGELDSQVAVPQLIAPPVTMLGTPLTIAGTSPPTHMEGAHRCTTIPEDVRESPLPAVDEAFAEESVDAHENGVTDAHKNGVTDAHENMCAEEDAEPRDYHPDADTEHDAECGRLVKESDGGTRTVKKRKKKKSKLLQVLGDDRYSGFVVTGGKETPAGTVSQTLVPLREEPEPLRYVWVSESDAETTASEHEPEDDDNEHHKSPDPHANHNHLLEGHWQVVKGGRRASGGSLDGTEASDSGSLCEQIPGAVGPALTKKEKYAEDCMRMMDLFDLEPHREDDVFH